MQPRFAIAGLAAALLVPALANAEPRLTSGAELSGDLAAGDTTSSRGSFEDGFLIDLTAGQSLKVELRSSDFDAFLSATGPDGATVGEDDDSLGGSNARLNFTATQSGRYRIVASTYQRGQMGHYTLRSEVWVRHPLAVARLELPARVEAALTDEDARRGDGQFVKAYRFAGRAADELLLTLRTTFAGSLILLAPTGETVGESGDSGTSGEAKLRATLPMSGEYTLLATSAESGVTGPFTLEALGAAPASATPPRPLTPGAMTRATLQAQQGGARVSDRYTIVAKGGQYLDARMTAEGFDALLSLVSPSGELLANDDDGGGGTNARIRYTLPSAGTYTLIASRFEAASGGDYLISADLAQPPPVASQPLRLGTPIKGEFTSGDVRLVQGTAFADLYRLDGRAGQSVTATVTSHAMPELRVTAPTGEALSIPPVQATGESTFTLPQTGTYLLALVSERSDEAAYQFKVAEADPKALEVSRTKLPIGATFEGEFRASDRTRSGVEGRVDAYEVEVTTPGLYDLTLEADQLDPVVELQTSDGEVIEQNDDYGGNTNARIRRPLAAGRYRVLAMSLGDNLGRYRLRLDAAPDLPFEMNTVQSRSVVAGELTTEDPLLTEINRRADIYRLHLKAGEAVTITLRSGDFDSLLRVVDELGAVLGMNDDFGEQVDARVSFVQPFDGDVRIYCTSVGGGDEEEGGSGAGNETGAYRLEVAPGLTRPSETSL